MGKVTLELTTKEAKALSYVIGNSMEHADVMDSLFDNPQEKKAAYRAGNKLQDAIRKAEK